MILSHVPSQPQLNGTQKAAEGIEEKGLSTIGHPTNGNYAFFRKTELAAALNRLRSLEIE
ncbi:MAG: hypothetical protein ACLFPH_04125 [Bacteroidales bacterium]